MNFKTEKWSFDLKKTNGNHNFQVIFARDYLLIISKLKGGFVEMVDETTIKQAFSIYEEREREKRKIERAEEEKKIRDKECFRYLFERKKITINL